MEEAEVLELLKSCGALLEGHFELSSGLRSNRYVQCALALMWPARAGRLGVALGERFADTEVDVVVGPAMGGIVIGHETARFLGVRFLFAERKDGRLELRRGFRIEPDERVLVVEDVVTTGGSARETIDLVRQAGGRVVGVGAIVDRTARGAEPFGDIPFRALARVEAEVWTPEEDPLAREGSVPTKPGSRPDAPAESEGGAAS